MMRTTLKPSEKRLFRISEPERKRSRTLWARDFVTAFLRFYVNMDKDEYEELQDLEVEISGAPNNMLNIWIGEDCYTIEDLTNFKEDYLPQ